MSQLLRETISAAERAVAGEDSRVRDYLERLFSNPGELRSCKDTERVYLAALLDFIGLHNESMRVLRDVPDAMSRNMEGMLAAAHGQHERARTSLVEALGAATDSPQLRRQILANLAEVSLRTESVEEAEAWIEEADGAGQAGNPAVEVLIATVRAGIASRRGDLSALRSAAAALKEASESRLTELGTEHPQALAVVANMANTEIMMARAENSAVRLERAIDVLDVVAFRLAAELGADNPQTEAVLASLAAARADVAPAARAQGLLQVREVPFASVRNGSLSVVNRGADDLAYVLDELERVASVSPEDAPGLLSVRAAIHLDQINMAPIRMPRYDPEFAPLTASMGLRALGLAAEHRSVMEYDRAIAELSKTVAGLSRDDPGRAVAECRHWALVCQRGLLQHQPDAVNAALAELRYIASSANEAHPARAQLIGAVAFALIGSHSMSGDIRHLGEAEDYLRLAFEAVERAGLSAVGSAGVGGLLYLHGYLELIWCSYDPHPDRVERAVSDLQSAGQVLGQDQLLQDTVASLLEAAGAVRELLAASHDRDAFLEVTALGAFDKLLAAAESLGQDHPEYPKLIAMAADGLVRKGTTDNNPKLIDRAVALLTGAQVLPGLSVSERPRLLTMHGSALLALYMMLGSPNDVSRAIDLLEEARRAVEQMRGSPYAATILETLSRAYRLRGRSARDVDRAVACGLAGLREHAGNVLLQDRLSDALHAARRGTSDATEMARWFLTHSREAAAVSALELGRGLVLHAATSGPGVEEALRQAGHTDLAAEWAVHDDSDFFGSAADLRYRAMLALDQSPAEVRLLSPPSAGDIAEALADSGADALVYLLPRDDSGTGLAVIVDPAGTVHAAPLPVLSAYADGPVAAFQQASRDLHTDFGAGPRDMAFRLWEDKLDELCDWAWQAAIGPLLEAIPQRGRDRDRRIVLVPGGELGLVPWHAARQPGTGRYACQHAVFSYASSARQFIDAARCQFRPWTETPILISDSESALVATARSIGYLFTEYYQSASVFGFARHLLPDSDMPGADAATPDDVLSALPRAGIPGASMLHFGVHSSVDVPGLHSGLALGDGHEVHVGDILRQVRKRRSGQDIERRSCGLVVLASCMTDAAHSDYDEALTPASAFMSASAGGVVAARWFLPEFPTAVFMIAFHHYLNAGQLTPAAALRQAQLWMLDPSRELPGTLPRMFRDESESTDLARPASWAGFAYHGR